MRNCNSSKHVAHPCGQSLRGQRGVALITAMVILVILTIIGISAFSTTSLESRMAVNSQQSTRAFQASESGLAEAIGAGVLLDLYSTHSQTYNFGSGAQATSATVDSSFKGWSNPKRGSGFSVVNFRIASFEQTSTGTAPGNATRTISQGLGQISPKEE